MYRESLFVESCKGKITDSCLASVSEEPRLYGDYQYYMSLGGDQFLDIPTVIDNNFGIQGIVIHVSHFIAGQTFELSGYTAFGKKNRVTY